MNKLSLLTSLLQGETLHLYLVVNREAVSSVLVHKEDGVQKPMYFISRIQRDGEKNYAHTESGLCDSHSWLIE